MPEKNRLWAQPPTAVWSKWVEGCGIICDYKLGERESERKKEVPQENTNSARSQLCLCR